VPIGRKYYKLHCQEKALKREVYRLTEKRVLLNNELRLLATDPVYVEQVARRVFNKAKEGEVVCKFVSPEELE
jgi:cell division protein FtsB